MQGLQHAEEEELPAIASRPSSDPIRRDGHRRPRGNSSGFRRLRLTHFQQHRSPGKCLQMERPRRILQMPVTREVTHNYQGIHSEVTASCCMLTKETRWACNFKQGNTNPDRYVTKSYMAALLLLKSNEQSKRLSSPPRGQEMPAASYEVNHSLHFSRTLCLQRAVRTVTSSITITYSK